MTLPRWYSDMLDEATERMERRCCDNCSEPTPDDELHEIAEQEGEYCRTCIEDLRWKQME